MNVFKWLLCWWRRQHVQAVAYDREGRYHSVCLRCGERWYN